ncbi:hypothetical protein PFISCL1PPCAC_16463, partial [Pristionchus fissidentatus]
CRVAESLCHPNHFVSFHYPALAPSIDVNSLMDSVVCDSFAPSIIEDELGMLLAHFGRVKTRFNEAAGRCVIIFD